MTNFFYLDNNPKKCATYYCDKHVNKIMIEIALLLSQAHHELSKKKPPYKRFYVNSSEVAPYQWIKASKANYIYSVKLAQALLNEYKYRYQKDLHKSEKAIEWLSKNIPPLPDIPKTKFYLTLNVRVYHEYFTSSVEASRFAYVDFKCKKDKWTRRNKPSWFDKYKKISDKNRKKLIKMVLINVKKKLPKLAEKYKWKVKYPSSFLRICYDNLFNDDWRKKIKTLPTMFDSNLPLLYQLGYGHLLKIYEISKKLSNKDNLYNLNKISLIYRNKI